MREKIPLLLWNVSNFHSSVTVSKWMRNFVWAFFSRTRIEFDQVRTSHTHWKWVLIHWKTICSLKYNEWRRNIHARIIVRANIIRNVITFMRVPFAICIYLCMRKHTHDDAHLLKFIFNHSRIFLCTFELNSQSNKPWILRKIKFGPQRRAGSSDGSSFVSFWRFFLYKYLVFSNKAFVFRIYLKCLPNPAVTFWTLNLFVGSFGDDFCWD